MTTQIAVFASAVSEEVDRRERIGGHPFYVRRIRIREDSGRGVSEIHIHGGSYTAVGRPDLKRLNVSPRLTGCSYPIHQRSPTNDRKDRSVPNMW